VNLSIAVHDHRNEAGLLSSRYGKQPSGSRGGYQSQLQYLRYGIEPPKQWNRTGRLLGGFIVPKLMSF
jgi:hypothetical protein